jgi:hypothetical protein
MPIEHVNEKVSMGRFMVAGNNLDGIGFYSDLLCRI